MSTTYWKCVTVVTEFGALHDRSVEFESNLRAWRNGEHVPCWFLGAEYDDSAFELSYDALNDVDLNVSDVDWSGFPDEAVS